MDTFLENADFPQTETVYVGTCPDKQCEEHEGTQNTEPICPVCEKPLRVDDIREVINEG